jgi:hypothetical protein
VDQQLQLKIYYQIKKHILIPNSSCFGLVKELQRNFFLELEDIHHSLFVKFLEEKHPDEFTNINGYLARFCFMRLMDMKKYYERVKRADCDWRNRQSYDSVNEEDKIIDIIDENYE